MKEMKGKPLRQRASGYHLLVVSLPAGTINHINQRDETSDTAAPAGFTHVIHNPLPVVAIV